MYSQTQISSTLSKHKPTSSYFSKQNTTKGCPINWTASCGQVSLSRSTTVTSDTIRVSLPRDLTPSPTSLSPNPSPSMSPPGDDSPIFTSNSYEQPIHVPYEFSSFSSDGAILPPPVEMQPEQGSALREWRRLNAIRLEEKEMREKEVLSQISDEADEFKVDFYRKREITVETNKATNREKEKLFVASHEKFHAEAAGNYWKSIGELIPNEVPTIEKKKGKKDDEKKPSTVVINGPKPGKATDLSRMRQILLKLKHNTPPHLKPSPPAGNSTKADSATAPVATAVASSSEPVAVA